MSKQLRRKKRHKRVRAKIFGTKDRPRFCVFKSNKHLYAQLIDDEKGKVILNASDKDVKSKKNDVDSAKELGGLIAKKALEGKIEKVVFDRSGYVYHGKVKAVADGAREGGLKF